MTEIMERALSQYEEGNYVVPLEELKKGEEVTIYDKNGYYIGCKVRSIILNSVMCNLGDFDVIIHKDDID